MPAAQQKSGRRSEDPESAETASDAMDRIEDAASALADRGSEAVADAGEAVRRAGRSARVRASRMAEQARNAGGEAISAIETEMTDRPWTIALAAAVAAGVLGYLLGRRRW